MKNIEYNFAEILLAYGLSREQPEGRNIWPEVRLS